MCGYVNVRIDKIEWRLPFWREAVGTQPRGLGKIVALYPSILKSGKSRFRQCADLRTQRSFAHPHIKNPHIIIASITMLIPLPCVFFQQRLQLLYLAHIKQIME
jgi:hypothetical protein